MHLFHVSLGGGISGTQSLLSLVDKITTINKKRKLNKKITLAVVEKDPKNIPGGVAYGFDKCFFGFFNNPLRLSPDKFTRWVLKNKNRLLLIDYLNKYGGHTGKQWIRDNKNILFSKNKKDLNELYIPRAMMHFWMQEKLILCLDKINKVKNLIQIKFFKGEVESIIKNKDYYELKFKKNFCEELNHKILKDKFNRIVFDKKNKISKKLFSKNLNIGLGLPPPAQIATYSAQKNKNYVWDFYEKGSTDYLIKRISNFSNKKKPIMIYFVGYKAGLLEALPELSKRIINEKINVKIICSSRELQSIQKAELSLGKKKYRTKYFKRDQLYKIDTAEKLYYSILKEFKFSMVQGYNKYDAWTFILKNNLIFYLIKKFNINEKKRYDDFFHSKIRGVTRFTYPETINAREFLSKRKILIAKKEKVSSIDVINDKLIVTAKNKRSSVQKYKCDIVINVSGPLNAEKIKKEVPLIYNLKKMGALTISGNLVVSNFFEIKGLNNIYIPGILARGFNPERKTLINAILGNCNLVANSISRTISE